MGRLRGGYLGGSTIINPSKASGPADEGPIAALERARIESLKLAAANADLQQARAAADKRLTAVEQSLYVIAHVGRYDLFNDRRDEELKLVSDFVDIELDGISRLGPGQQRRSKIIKDDHSLLLKAFAPDASDRFLNIWKTTAYQTRIRPVEERAMRMTRRPSR